ncbi:hypothetical protein [Natrinema caseinilyticum]|uniref:hypothetical protein n=1 Tax=Natrinema caseinilyticum TaxID=2961570 RepID=UPI0020C529C0|nr:hypothetical protein [Natrinema caseinilyticum]
MDRRKFLVVAGFGTGLAGCLNANPAEETGLGNETGGGDTGSTTGPSRATDGGDPGSETGENGTDSSEKGADKNGDDESTPEKKGETDEKEKKAKQTDDSGRVIRFPSCTRAEVTGTFEESDVAFASTGFFDDGLFGDTILEDGVVFGEDVPAPFTGTVAFEIGTGSGVSRRPEKIIIEIPNYGSDGTIITSVTTERSDFEAVSDTAVNPRARDCLREIEPEGNDGA